MEIVILHHQQHWHLCILHLLLAKPNKILCSHDFGRVADQQADHTGPEGGHVCMQRGEWGGGGVDCGVVMGRRRSLWSRGSSAGGHSRPPFDSGRVSVRLQWSDGGLFGRAKRSSMVRRLLACPHISKAARVATCTAHVQLNPIDHDGTKLCYRPHQSFLIITSGDTK
jgi:hypothetical protein